jgi:predicted nucleotidyltransferase
MRLTEPQIKAIKHTAHAVLGEGTHVTLFGSRVDDAAKRGDIDLLFTTPANIDNPAQTVGRIYAQLVRQLGDQKIDILLKAPNLQPQPIHAIAEQSGIQL